MMLLIEEVEEVETKDGICNKECMKQLLEESIGIYHLRQISTWTVGGEKNR